MKKVRVEDAVGFVLIHDMTKIVKGEYKGARFKKGHIITESDIDELKNMGKEHIFVAEKNTNQIHEDDAAVILSDICYNNYMKKSKITEGKIELRAAERGFFQVNVEKLYQINLLDDIMISTRMGNIPVEEGDRLAGMRIIPLLIDKDQLQKAVDIKGEEPILKITPFRKNLKGAIITTGQEVYSGRIQDKFSPVLYEKFQEYGVTVIQHTVCPDDKDRIANAIEDAKEKGADIILCSGGMSVDPDDLTPAAIRQASEEIVCYGTPVLPGAMFMVAYDKDVCIMGLPGCVMFTRRTVFDILFPYSVAGIRMTKEMIAKLGYGGLALKNDSQDYPNCMFGKGV